MTTHTNEPTPGQSDPDHLRPLSPSADDQADLRERSRLHLAKLRADIRLTDAKALAALTPVLLSLFALVTPSAQAMLHGVTSLLVAWLPALLAHGATLAEALARLL